MYISAHSAQRNTCKHVKVGFIIWNYTVKKWTKWVFCFNCFYSLQSDWCCSNLIELYWPNIQCPLKLRMDTFDTCWHLNEKLWFGVLNITASKWKSQLRALLFTTMVNTTLNNRNLLLFCSTTLLMSEWVNYFHFGVFYFLKMADCSS